MHFIYAETLCSQWIKKNSHQDLIITRKDSPNYRIFSRNYEILFFLFSECNAFPQIYAIQLVCLFLTNPECYYWKLLLMLADDVSQWSCLLTCWTLTDWSGKLSLEAIQVVCEELRKKGVCTMQCWSTVVVVVSALSQLTVTGHSLSICPSLALSCSLSLCREPGVAGQKQEPLPGHVEEAGGVGQVYLPVGGCEEHHLLLLLLFSSPSTPSSLERTSSVEVRGHWHLDMNCWFKYHQLSRAAINHWVSWCLVCQWYFSGVTDVYFDHLSSTWSFYFGSIIYTSKSNRTDSRRLIQQSSSFWGWLRLCLNSECELDCPNSPAVQGHSKSLAKLAAMRYTYRPKV